MSVHFLKFCLVLVWVTLTLQCPRTYVSSGKRGGAPHTSRGGITKNPLKLHGTGLICSPPRISQSFTGAGIMVNGFFDMTIKLCVNIKTILHRGRNMKVKGLVNYQHALWNSLLINMEKHWSLRQPLSWFGKCRPGQPSGCWDWYQYRLHWTLSEQ